MDKHDLQYLDPPPCTHPLPCFVSSPPLSYSDQTQTLPLFGCMYPKHTSKQQTALLRIDHPHHYTQNAVAFACCPSWAARTLLTCFPSETLLRFCTVQHSITSMAFFYNYGAIVSCVYGGKRRDPPLKNVNSQKHPLLSQRCHPDSHRDGISLLEFTYPPPTPAYTTQ
jgi:hypothetical protein